MTEAIFRINPLLSIAALTTLAGEVGYSSEGRRPRPDPKKNPAKRKARKRVQRSRRQNRR